MTRIRSYVAADASHLSALYRRSVLEVGSRDYGPAQIQAWAALAPSPERLQIQSEDGRIRLVASDALDLPVAFADLEPDGHIDLFYCAPEAAGTGIAAALYEALESSARQQGMTRLYAEASERARPFFLKQGFAVIAKREFEVTGVPIHNYAVEKSLAL